MFHDPPLYSPLPLKAVKTEGLATFFESVKVSVNGEVLRVPVAPTTLYPKNLDYSPHILVAAVLAT